MRVEALFHAMLGEKTRRGATLRFILLRDIGDPVISEEVPAAAVADVLSGLQPR
jgi:3-dehydroquinate synthetase